ncbi:DNA-processing protein DprA [Agromyces mediolanus]|uniref:DNA-processing protein DprA n=1 Tax=Agromyces mediolanus TaxID=41986 RepID=UPI0038336083
MAGVNRGFRAAQRDSEAVVARLRATPGAQGRASDEDAAARAALSLLAEPGDGTLGTLVAALGAEETASFIASDGTADRLVARLGGDVGLTARAVVDGISRWRPRLDAGALVRSLAQAQRIGAGVLVPGDPGWPRRLDDLGVHAPLAVWVRGDPALVAAPAAIAVVGARAATGYGEQLTLESVAGLVDRGCTIVSGGAYGIDGAAHRAALHRGGATVAVLAGGADRFYPQGHAALLDEIAVRGAVISELPCGAAPTKWRFLARNRVIAALSGAVVVVEAGWRSGALNTAHHAATLGRPVGVVPGPVTSPASAGCHRLLREQEAVCVTDAAEMAELLGPTGGAVVLESPTAEPESTERRPDRSHDEFGELELRMLDAMSARVPRPAAELAARAGIEPPRALGALGTLDALGRVRRTTEGWLLRGRG